VSAPAEIRAKAKRAMELRPADGQSIGR
jgi:hypothetical protein